VNGTYIFTKTLSGGTHNWSILSFNNNSLSTQSSVYFLNIISGTAFFENSQVYNNQTTEGNVEIFKVNVSYDSSYYPNMIGRLIYNGTSYTGIQTGSGVNTVFTRTINIPSVTTDTNVTFYWRFDMIHNSTSTDYHNSTSHNQTIYNIGIGDCNATYTYPLINLTMKDEDSRTDLNGATQNTSLEANINIYTLDRAINILSLSSNYSKVNPVSICINNPLTTSYYSMDATFKYLADDYVTEYYNIQNLTISSSNIPQLISLYDLLITNSQEFLIIYKDADLTPQGDVLIEITRQYLPIGQFLVVEIPKTDIDGRTIGHFVLNDEIYTIYVKKDGVLLGVWNNVRAFCSNIATGDCRINLNAAGSHGGIGDYKNYLGVTYSESYDDNTKTYSFSFSTNDGSNKNLSMNVVKNDNYLNDMICHSEIVSSSGTLTCIIPSSYYNNTALVKIYSNGELLTSSSFEITMSKSLIFGSMRYLLAFVLIVTLPLLAISSAPMAVLFFIIGLIGVAGLFLGDFGGYTGAFSVSLWFVIAAIILLYKITRSKT
jgi:hypothetical protein